MVATRIGSLRGVVFAFAVWQAAMTGSLCSTAEAQQPLRPRQAELPTHIVGTATEYYTTGPQQGRAPDGTLPAGTRVTLVRAAGGYSQVRTEAGLVAFVATDALAKIITRADVTPQVRQVAQSINAFSFDLYGQLREEDGNRFFSPASISTALAMTYAGAGGRTEEEMARTLHFGGAELPGERLHEAFGTMTALLNSSGQQGGYVLRTANRLWGQEDFGFRPAFLELTRERYGAELATLDFAQEPAARQAINEWVARQTQDRIENLIPPGVLSRDTRLVLTNAIYFKGAWEHEFNKRTTRDEPFHLSPERKVEVPLMRQTARFAYARHDDVQVLELPYVGREVSMVVLLPHEIGGLAELEGKLTQENYQRWAGSLRVREVEVYLPRFTMTSEFQLGDTLKAMGMPTAFTDDADFSKMSEDDRLAISEVVHKAFVEVNEEGTEAAAATGVVIGVTSAPLPEQKVVFRADHPFVFLLRENRTGAVLFLGRVVQPK